MRDSGVLESGGGYSERYERDSGNLPGLFQMDTATVKSAVLLVNLR